MNDFLRVNETFNTVDDAIAFLYELHDKDMKYKCISRLIKPESMENLTKDFFYSLPSISDRLLIDIAEQTGIILKPRDNGLRLVYNDNCDPYSRLDQIINLEGDDISLEMNSGIIVTKFIGTMYIKGPGVSLYSRGPKLVGLEFNASDVNYSAFVEKVNGLR